MTFIYYRRASVANFGLFRAVSFPWHSHWCMS